jgi:hypothetical protein
MKNFDKTDGISYDELAIKEEILTVKGKPHPILFIIGSGFLCWAIYTLITADFGQVEHDDDWDFLIVFFGSQWGGAFAIVCLLEAFFPPKALILSEKGIMIYGWVILKNLKQANIEAFRVRRLFEPRSYRYFFPWQSIKDIQFSPGFAYFSMSLFLDRNNSDSGKTLLPDDDKIDLRVEKMDKDPAYIYHEINKYWVRNRNSKFQQET